MSFKLFVTIGMALIFLSCKTETAESQTEKSNPNEHQVTVEEVIHTKTYSYLRVSENSAESWIAITKREVAEGDVLYYSTGLEMKDFVSKELDRTFDKILFVDNISSKPGSMGNKNLPKSPFSSKQVEQKEGINLAAVEGGVSIAEVFSKKDSFSGQNIRVRGEVVKFNSQIMGRNWVHIQDGTNDADNYDLTITTNETVKIGDIVTFEGTISLNKDFGAGYSYTVIMEDAKLNANN